MRRLRIAIVGCKNMGKKHLNCLRNNFADRVRVVGILNSTTESTQKTARELEVEALESLEKISKRKIDAVIISTPPENHYETAKILLEKGMPLLIEKPLTTDVEQSYELLQIAKQKEVPVLVGHTENYNPAVMKLKEILDCSVKSIAAIRTSQNGGVKDTHIISELMIHDLAIVNSLLQDEWNEARVSKKEEYRWDEHAVVEMKYNKGSIVRLEALRSDDIELKRQMRIIDTKNNIWQINFMKRELIKNGEVICQGGDSLKQELSDFIDMVVNDKEPKVGINEACALVELCSDLENIR